MMVGDEDEDTISKLPDGILHSILSFLPTKDAIRTSVLSRRWKYMWTSLSNIDLDDWRSYWFAKGQLGDLRDRVFFLDFVDRVLMLHDDSDIKSFHLRFRASVNASRVNLWVSAALKHNCKELNLSLPKGGYVLPCFLFTCQWLTKLNIDIECGILELPTSVHLPSLKRLHLSSLTLRFDCSSFFSNCPVLEGLTLINCEWKKIKCLTIANPSLKSLTVVLEIPGGLDAKLKVYAASLTSLGFISYNKINVSLLDAPSLVNAYVEQFVDGEWARDGGRCAFKLLCQMLNLKSLNVHDDTLTAIALAENFLVQLPVFHNLTHFGVDGGQFSCKTAKWLVDFMQKMPNLESLSIGTDTNNSFENMKDEDILEVVPCCLRSKLKTFRMLSFEGAESETHLLEFVLNNAAVLELVEISFWVDDISEEMLESARKELQLLPRCSEKCEMIVRRDLS